MPQPDHSKTVSTDPNGSPTRAEQQDTVLLGDLPVPQTDPAPAASASAAANAPQLSAQAIAVLSQRYEILGEAGHGSMGNVYKARDRETREIVALKLLKPEIASDQAMMDRFKNELLFARKITHKNVCRVHEFNRIGGIAYTSMEFVEGESLRSVLNRFGGLPVRKALDLAQQICSGLQEAHAQGIVHRDLKPENVMVDAQGNVKIMDFGIARSMEAGTRLTGSMVGTPAYMAPEQVAGKPVDYRTDVYSLGLILYEVFTGTPAFHAENAVAVALKQMRESAPPPHEIEPTIPAAVERAVMKCLEKEPVKRFQSVADLKNALKGSASTPSQSPAAPAISAAEQSRQRASAASHPLYGSSALSVAQPKRGSSPFLWILLIAVVGGAAYAGWQQPEIRAAVQQLVGEVRPATPKPAAIAPAQPAPASASGEETPSNPKPIAASRAHATHPVVQQSEAQSSSEDAAPTPANAHTASPQSEQALDSSAAAPAAKPAVHSAADSAPTDSKQDSGDNATPAAATTAPKHANKQAGDDGPLTIPPTNDRLPSYVWVGRYEREDRAQDASQKISSLGLPVVIVPRRTPTGQAYVVVTGPFGPDRVTSVVDWLKTQGFLGVHPISTAPGQGRPNANQHTPAEP